MAEVVGLTIATFVVAIIAGVGFIVPLVVIGDEIETTAVLIGATVAGQLAMLVLGKGYVRYRDVPVPLRRPTRAGDRRRQPLLRVAAPRALLRERHRRPRRRS